MTIARNDERHRRVIGARLGLCYGVFLFALAWQLAAGGNGTYLPLHIFAAPLGVITPATGLIGVLLLWMGIGVGLTLPQRTTVRRIILGVLVLHYLGVGYALWIARQDGWSDEAHVFDKSRYLLIVSFALYLAGQVGIWIALVRRRSRPATEAR